MQNVDEEQINYELLESLVAYILRTEIARGPDALVAQARLSRPTTRPTARFTTRSTSCA